MTHRHTRPIALLVTRNLPPMVGGMERLVWHIVDELRVDYRVHVIGPQGCGRHLPDGVTVSEIPIKPMVLFLLRCKWAAVVQALRLRPTLVFAGSGLTAPFAWLAARLVRARCVVYLHGLDIETSHPIYRTLWHPFIRRCDRILVNSGFTRDLAQETGIDPARTRIVYPGVEIPDMNRFEQRGTDFRIRHQLGVAPLMLYVGRITVRKGLSVFVQSILPGIFWIRPDARLVVIGDEPKLALRQEPSQYARIVEILTKKDLMDRVLFLGELPQDSMELSAAYFAADVHVFPVQSRPGDNEGFGMVAIEAAAYGTPTVAFAAGGVPDAVADGRSGRLIAPGDNRAFTEAVIDCLSRDDAEKRLAARRTRQFAKAFAWLEFGTHLRQQLEKLHEPFS